MTLEGGVNRVCYRESVCTVGITMTLEGSPSEPERLSSSPLKLSHPEIHHFPPMDMEDQDNFWLTKSVKQNYNAVNSPHHFHFTEL
ncbi:unnamed protein product [Arctogadus glacialis]